MDTELESMMETFDTENEFAERRRNRRPTARPSGRPLTTPQPQQGYVTRNEFNTAMEKVRTELTAASNGLKTLDGRVNTISTAQERLTREVNARKRENEGLRKDLKSTRELAALLPLIATNSKTEKFPDSAGAGLAGKDYLAPSGNSMGVLAPLLLLGSGDSSSGSSGGLLGGSDSSMMMLLLLFAFNK